MSGITVTFNGTVGFSSSSDARQVAAILGAASGLCDGEKHQKLVVRKNALDGTPDTTLPLAVDVAFPVLRALVVRSVNSASVTLTYTPAIGTPQVVPLVLGDPSHPEGLLVLMGSFSGMALAVTDVGADGTEIEVWSAGS